MSDDDEQFPGQLSIHDVIEHARLHKPHGPEPYSGIQPRARARRGDVETSHAAAATVTDIRRSQLAVLQVLKTYGPQTDEDIGYLYEGSVMSDGAPKQSPSGLRTRRKELVEQGMVADTGERRRLGSGRGAIVWGATE